MRPFWLRSPKTRKVTAEGVRVLTSREVPWRGKSLDRRSCDALPISYVDRQYLFGMDASNNDDGDDGPSRQGE